MTSQRLSLLLACGGSFLAFLDVTITNLALPALAEDFHVDVTSLSWVVTLYAIPFAALLAPAGRLADVIGRRRLFAAGVALFTASSLVAAVAPVYGVLLAARAVQGVGAALLMPASLAFVLADTAAERRPAAIGLWSASGAAAAALGPSLGGVLVDVFDWRALFCINVPIGAWLALRTLRLPAVADGQGRLPDLVGAAMFTAGIGLVVLGVTQGDAWGWGDPATVASLVGGVAVTAFALRRSAGHPEPAVPMDLWRNRVYATSNVASAFAGAALYAWMLLGVLFLVQVWDYSELQAGLAMTHGAVAAGAAGVVAGRSARAPSPRVLVAGGGLLTGLTGLVMALYLPVEPHFVTFWLPLGLIGGAGMGAVSVGISSAAALSVAPQRFAAATGLSIAARQVGGALGVAALAVILSGATGIEPFRHVYGLAALAYGAAALAGLGLGAPAKAPAPASAVAAATAGRTR